MKFMGGEPMNPATNRLTGWSYSSRGVCTCCSTPLRSTATRSPSVMASTWSCVTYTVVIPSRFCRREISVRTWPHVAGIDPERDVQVPVSDNTPTSRRRARGGARGDQELGPPRAPLRVLPPRSRPPPRGLGGRHHGHVQGGCPRDTSAQPRDPSGGGPQRPTPRQRAPR